MSITAAAAVKPPPSQQKTDDLFEVFKTLYGKSGEKANIYDAEFRRCVHVAVHTWYMQPHQPELDWSNLHALYMNIVRYNAPGLQGHRCGTPECHPLALSAGELFADPKYPGNPVLRASGNVWLCVRTLRMHVCEPNTACEFTEHNSKDRSEACTMTAVAKAPRISTAFAGLPRDTAAHVDMMVLNDTVQAAAAASTPSSRKRVSQSASKQKIRKRKSSYASAAPLATRTALAHDESSMTKLVAQVDPSSEVKNIIGIVFGPTGISYECARNLREAEAVVDAKVAEIAEHGPVCFAELASVVANNSARELVSLMQVADSLARTWTATAEDINYIADCVMRVLILLRQTPALVNNNTAVGSKGARDKEMCIPILCYLRDGCIGRVLRNIETDKLEYAVCTELDEQIHTMSEQESYSCVARFVFVPAHPGMAAALPSVVPSNLSEPMASYFARFMRRSRSRELPFVSVLKSTTLDPELYCLSRYITVRPDLFIRHRRTSAAAAATMV